MFLVLFEAADRLRSERSRSMEVPGSTVASSSEEKLCSLSPSKSILRDRSQKAGLSRK